MNVFDVALVLLASPLVGILCYGTYRSIVDPDAKAVALGVPARKKTD